jgi:hypothetical protein
MWDAPPGSAFGPLGGASCLYEGHTILNEIWTQDKIYILVDTLLGSNILLIT